MAETAAPPHPSQRSVAASGPFPLPDGERELTRSMPLSLSPLGRGRERAQARGRVRGHLLRSQINFSSSRR